MEDNSGTRRGSQEATGIMASGIAENSVASSGVGGESGGESGGGGGRRGSMNGDGKTITVPTTANTRGSLERGSSFKSNSSVGGVFNIVTQDGEETGRDTPPLTAQRTSGGSNMSKRPSSYHDVRGSAELEKDLSSSEEEVGHPAAAAADYAAVFAAV